MLGVYGVSLLAAASAGLLVWLAGALQQRAERASRERRRVAASRAGAPGAAVADGLGTAASRWTTPAGEPVTVSLVQGNIQQDMKWRPECGAGIARDLSRAHAAPRAAADRAAGDRAAGVQCGRAPEYLDALARHARDNGGDLLLGVPEYVARQIRRATTTA